MHELSLAQQMVSTFDRVARENGAERVTTATVKIGVLTCVEHKTLTFAFEIASRGTLLSECRLIIESVPLVVRCAACGHEGEADRDLLGCPACGTGGVEVVTGREIQLKSIDVEDERDA